MVLSLTTKVVLNWKGAQKGPPRRISHLMKWNRFLKERAFKQKPLDGASSPHGAPFVSRAQWMRDDVKDPEGWDPDPAEPHGLVIPGQKWERQGLHGSSGWHTCARTEGLVGHQNKMQTDTWVWGREQSAQKTVSSHSLPAMCGRTKPGRWSEGPVGRATEKLLEYGLILFQTPSSYHIPFLGIWWAGLLDFMAHVRKSGDNFFLEWVLSFHHMASWDRTEVTDKCLY